MAAKKLRRNSIGYEINPEFLPLIRDKLGIQQGMIFEEVEFEITRQKKAHGNHEQLSKQLPYIFKDPIKFDKKVDPRKLHFGSKINNDAAKREEYYAVKDIISAERLVIGDGLQVRLLGIKEKPEMSGEAIRFLTDKIRGQRVFIKFDTVKYDPDNNLLCYLYLENKTFLNAHLIKRGLADVDTSLEYKFKQKFLTAAGRN